jgi:hypothetical protein
VRHSARGDGAPPHARPPTASRASFPHAASPRLVCAARRVVAGGPEESVQQPVWDEDGTLYFISDRTNW